VGRIELLDSFRFIAVLFVVLYHYYSRWAIPYYPKNIYPYGGVAASYFQYGYLGVNFFFMISGFVILYMLEKTSTFKGFLLNRLIRLFPPMLLCASLTYLLVKFLDKSYNFPLFHSQSLDFLPSLTFTNTQFWNTLIPGKKFDYIDGSYWTLHYEVTFYIIAGVLYFIKKSNFISNWLLFTSLIVIINACRVHFFLQNHYFSLFISWFPLANQIIFFTVGLIAYVFYFKKHISKWNIILSCLLILFEYHHYAFDINLVIILVLFTALLAMFTFKPQYLNFLKIKTFQRIGLISYTIYLIHQFVGLILINKISQWVNYGPFILYIPILVIILIIFFADCSYRFFERPVSSFLKKLLSKHIELKKG